MRSLTGLANWGGRPKESTTFYVYDRHFCYQPVGEFWSRGEREAEALCAELNLWHRSLL